MSSKHFRIISKSNLKIILSIIVVLCLISVSISACGQGHNGKYKLTDMTYSDGEPFELFRALNDTTLNVSGTKATIHFSKQAIAALKRIEPLPETMNLTLSWDTWTCFNEDGDSMSFSCYENKFILDSDGVIWCFEK